MIVTKLNKKELALFTIFKDKKRHKIEELKQLFTDEAKKRCAVTYEKGWDEYEINIQSQSFVRNSLRRLVRDQWIDGPHTNANLPRGTYQISTKGIDKIKKKILPEKRVKKEPKPKIIKPKKIKGKRKKIIERVATRKARAALQRTKKEIGKEKARKIKVESE